MGNPTGGIGGGGCMGGGGGNWATPCGINIWFCAGGGGGRVGGGGGGGITGNGGLVDGSGGRFKDGNRSFGGMGGGGKNGFCITFCGFGGTVEFVGLIPGGIDNDCLTGKLFGVDNNFEFFVKAACIACSGVSTTIKITTQILKN